MAGTVVFHRLVQKDMSGVCDYYTAEAGEELADRFYEAFLAQVAKVVRNPERFHPLQGVLRRAPVPGFPYHFLYRRVPDGVRVPGAAA